jgi:RNA polymerase sigma-70 factor (ECF subfamily)
VHVEAALALRHIPLQGVKRMSEGMTADVLFRMYAPFVVRFIARLGVENGAIDDIVQEVFLVAHRRGGYQGGAAKPTTWLAEISLRIVSTHKRSVRRQRITPDERAVNRTASSLRDPSEAAEDRSSLERVQAALDALDDDRRMVFVLFELLGEPCEEIARAVGIPVGTVHSRLYAARREFQRVHARLVRDSAWTEKSMRGRAAT